MGTPVGGHQRMRRTTTDDYFALELDKGYVRLTINLGAGPHTMEYNKLYVADGVWTKITIERLNFLCSVTLNNLDFSNFCICRCLY